MLEKGDKDVQDILTQQSQLSVKYQKRSQTPFKSLLNTAHLQIFARIMHVPVVEAHTIGFSLLLWQLTMQQL